MQKREEFVEALKSINTATCKKHDEEEVRKLVLEQLITTQEALNDICAQFAKQKILAIDTEFVRTRTYFPKLGLIQICDGEQVALIDPLPIDDLNPVWRLIDNVDITKVVHACSEDVEIFLNQGNCQPKNMIDSQIMMSFLGHGLSVGYAAMVKHYLDIDLDKSDSRTDWIKRPLTESQLNYASADVIHLSRIFPKLVADIQATKWYEPAKQDSEMLIEKKAQPVDENNLYTNVKMSWKLNTKQLNNLKYLASWRYQQALKRDLPLSFVAKDITLFAFAQVAPKNAADMTKLSAADQLDIRHKGKQMLAVLKQADAVEDNAYPSLIKRLDQYPGYKQIFKKVKNYIASVATSEQQPVENFASKKQINQFLSWYYKDISPVSEVDMMKNWRLELFGEQLIEHAKSDFNSL